MSDAAFVWAAWADGLRPEPVASVSEWAERFRRLPNLTAEPGRWRNSRTPYLVGIMDALSPSDPAERVVFMKGAQIGATEAGNNWVGFIIANQPGLVLSVMPALDDVKRNSATRINPLIESTPALKERVVEAKSREAGNTMFRKKFVGGELIMTGATSAKGLRSTPARYLFLDEVDGYPADCDGEGDPVALAVQRTVTFRGRRKIYMVSTPTIAGFSRIERAYAESDQRVFEVQCKHCSDFFRITWATIKFDPQDPADAYCACPECGGVHEESDKFAMLSAGRWRATAKGDGRTAGFHLSALYSPFETWAEIASEFVSSRKDASRLKSWTNLKLGDAFNEDAEALDASGIASRREPFPAGDFLPPGVAVITAGVDVQQDRIEASIVGFGAGEESYVLDHVVLWGDITAPQVWQDLDDLLRRKYQRSDYEVELPIRAACVDSGYQTAIVMNWCRGKEGRRIWAIKGSSTSNSPLWPRQAPTKQKGKAPVFLVGSTAGKDLVLGRLKNVGKGPGVIHFNSILPDSYFEQLTAEKVRTKYVKGYPVREYFKPDSARNEALDCLCYANAALAGLKAARFDLDKEAHRQATTSNARVFSSPVATASHAAVAQPPAPPPVPTSAAARDFSSKPARPRVVRSAYLG